MTGAEMIAAERKRQISVEGWTPKHDDEHNQCEMVMVAQCYAEAAAAIIIGEPVCELPDIWPASWDAKWWKPSADPVRNLQKAGALIAAEIDRIQRSA